MPPSLERRSRSLLVCVRSIGATSLIWCPNELTCQGPILVSKRYALDEAIADEAMRCHWEKCYVRYGCRIEYRVFDCTWSACIVYSSAFPLTSHEYKEPCLVTFDKSLPKGSLFCQDTSLKKPSLCIVHEALSITYSSSSSPFVRFLLALSWTYLACRMSREMWEYASDGQLKFEKAINDFIPTLIQVHSNDPRRVAFDLLTLRNGKALIQRIIWQLFCLRGRTTTHRPSKKRSIRIPQRLRVAKYVRLQRKQRQPFTLENLLCVCGI